MSTKARVILFVIGIIVLLSSIYGFASSASVGFISLLVGLVLVAIPTISIIREKSSDSGRTTSTSDVSYTPAPPKGYTAQKQFVPAKSSPTPTTAAAAKPSIPRYYYTDYTRLPDLPTAYVCIDFETTGLYPEKDRITDAAAARVVDGQIVDTYSSLVHSPVAISAFVSNLTGITNEMISTAPEEDDVIRKLIAFIGDLPVIGYNVSFDLGFLHYAAHRASLPCPRENFDVQSYAKKGLPGRPGYKLENIAEYLSVDQPEAHRALADVLTTVACAEKLRGVVADIERQKAIAEYDFQNAYVDYKSFVPTVDHVDENSPLFGKRVVFTGTMSRMTRIDACQLVANLGGQPWGNVTKGTSYLVVGEGETSPHTDSSGITRKMQQADEWRAKGSAIKTVTETDFFKMLDEYENKKADL